MVDLKTGLSQRGATETQRRQLRIYAHLVDAVTGDMPKRIAIEDPAGRRWEETVTREDIAATVDEVLVARSAYESEVRANRWERLAKPDAETCRHCPYRLVCDHYWKTLELSWRHGSVAGAITSSRASDAGSITEVNAESPSDASGVWVVSAIPAQLRLTQGSVVVVNAETTGSDRLLRWRWSTMATVV